jgi:FMN-dependent NADH-azoreductase
MGKVLYIKASPRGDRSHSVAVADAFVEAYRAENPEDDIQMLDLFTADLPSFDGPTIIGKYNIMHGREHTAEQEKAWDRVVSIIEEFKSADKYVFAVPMWNFGIPYRLKQYIDIIVQPGYTFQSGDTGSEGLVTGKPVFVAYARGGEYAEGTDGKRFDMQKPYLELILGYIGLTDTRSVIVEPTLGQGPDVARQKRTDAIGQARRIAGDF